MLVEMEISLSFSLVHNIFLALNWHIFVLSWEIFLCFFLYYSVFLKEDTI